MGLSGGGPQPLGNGDNPTRLALPTVPLWTEESFGWRHISPALNQLMGFIDEIFKCKLGQLGELAKSFPLRFTHRIVEPSSPSFDGRQNFLAEGRTHRTSDLVSQLPPYLFGVTRRA